MKKLLFALCFLPFWMACTVSKSVAFEPSNTPIPYTLIEQGQFSPLIQTAYTRLKKEHLKTLGKRLYGGGRAMRLFMEKNSWLCESLYIRLNTDSLDEKEHFLYVEIERPLAGGASFDLRLSEIVDLCE